MLKLDQFITLCTIHNLLLKFQNNLIEGVEVVSLPPKLRST